MILLTQHEFSSATGDPIHQEFQRDAYRALTWAAWRLMDDFTAVDVQTSQTTIFVRSSGSGPPVLVLHGFSQKPPNVAEGRAAARAQRYGRLHRPSRLRAQRLSGVDCRPCLIYKRAMAQDMVLVIEHLGFRRFSVAGHDRGGRVAYRLALDHPDCVERLAVVFGVALWP
jgi:haloacetate dehalogenase